MLKIFISAVSALFSTSMLDAMRYANLTTPRHRIDFDRVGSKRVRTGKKYPHSSTRQNARIARQWAAGQLDYSASKFKGVAVAR